MRTAIVLAGGRSTRFGGDKLAYRLGGEALVDRAIDAVASVADEVIVIGRGLDSTRPAVRGIPDAEQFGGPLLALVAALDEARGTVAIVVGGDMPELVPAVLSRMLEDLEAGQGFQAVILATPGPTIGADRPELPRRQVLPLAIRVQPAARAAREAVEAGRRSLQALVDRVAVVELSPSIWRPLDPRARTLLDVDTPGDLARFRDPDPR